MTRAILLTMVAALLGGPLTVSGDDGVFLFRYANAQNPGDPRSVSMEFFKTELELRTGGRIKVENYFGGILGTEREIADAVAIGALQGIAQSETYSGLRTGVVDGTTAPPSDLWDRRQYEVLDWVTIDTHATGPDPLMVNLEWYQRLPPEPRTIFDDVARQALERSDELYSASEEKIIADLAEFVEIIYPTPEVRAEMRERTRPVYDFFVDRGDFTWADIEAADTLRRAPAEPPPDLCLQGWI